MPKFNPNRWVPTDDSSLGFRTTDPKRVVLNVLRTDREGCPCGCATMPVGAKARFSMGHDATLRGKLIRAHLMDVEIRLVYNGNEEQFEIYTAADLADLHHWKSYLDAAVMKREIANRQVVKKATESSECLEIGRWRYTGQVAAIYPSSTGDFMVEHVDRAGAIRRTKVSRQGIKTVTA